MFGLQALIVKHQALNLGSTGQYRGGPPCSHRLLVDHQILNLKTRGQYPVRAPSLEDKV